MKRQKSHVDETELLASDDEEEEEDEIMDVDMPDSRNHREKEEEILNQFKQKQKLLTPHPISFTVAIPGDGNLFRRFLWMLKNIISETHKSNLIFSYLPELDIVMVKPVVNLKATYE